MEHFEKQLKKGQKVHMSPDEKSVIRYSISKFIEIHPILGTISENPIHEPKVLRVSPFVYNSPFTFMRLMKGVTIVLIALLVGGSTLTYASGNALPGDALYTIKVNVKEAIEEKLTTTTEEKAQYQVKRIQKRFEEIKTLENKGDLTPEKEAIVEQVFNSHTEALNETLATLESEGKKDAVIETTSQLLPVLNDYSNATPTEAEKPADTNVSATEESAIDTNLEDSPETSPSISAMKSVPIENQTDSGMTSDPENSDVPSANKTDDTQNHKLATTFIAKIKKEKAHLEERAEKSSRDSSEVDNDNTENQSIDDVIKSIDSLLNSINVELDRDVTAEEIFSVSNDDESVQDSDTKSTNSDASSDDSTKVQIDISGSIGTPTL